MTLRTSDRVSVTRQARRRGFSMIEIVAVLTITGIVAALAYPKIDVGRYKADAVVTGVRSTMQQAQRASLVSQHDVIVSFDVAGNRIRRVWDANNDHHVGDTERVMWSSLSSGNKFAKPGEGVRGGTVTAAVVGATTRLMDNMPTVTFHRDGSLSSDLEIYMTTVANTATWRAVTVVQATGRTDWYRTNKTTGKWTSGAL